MRHLLAVGAMVPHRLRRVGASRTTRVTLHRLPAHTEIGDDMTIRRAVLCDQCDAVFASTEQIANYQLIEQAHQDGWTSTNRGGTWTNQCPEHDH